ncbi:MAG: 4Fe-4S dicluster domain-containing protein [Chloroflexi bacterium]|nr:4Fe-4S dicluster domain-containing protein [Chloroflexota bacterium]MBM3175816.1 4Fe-4S dicluster domain-containing protein [Chloroflexota bacterium]MBM4450436.1 4Fe-4S dicluster domain-containing protein [Chloroflexota bacterium]
MQLGFYIDQSRCIGCHTCAVACKDWHDIPAGAVNWRRVVTIEKGQYPAVFVAFLSLSCLHCAEPACMSVCPIDAIEKRECDGIVVVNQEACLGKDACGVCQEACPWGMPQFGTEPDAKMQKCHFCIDRWSERRKPICVEACPVWALDAGPLDELESRHGVLREVDGLKYDERNRPSVIFKAREPELLKLPPS